MMQSAGMEVPDWMRNLRKEKPHLKQLKHDKRRHKQQLLQMEQQRSSN